MPVSRKMPAAAIVYSVWLIFYLACTYFNILSLPEHMVFWTFAAASAVCMIVTGLRITTLQFSPVILITFFILTGRLTAYAANLISIDETGFSLFRLPFGGLDYFLFILLISGLFRYLKFHDEEKTMVFYPPALSFVLLIVIPYFTDLRGGSLLSETIYSFIYAASAAAILSAAVIFFKNRSRYAGIAYAAGLCVIFDLTVYLLRIPALSFLPAGLNYLLIPYAMFMLTHAAVGVKEDEIND